MIYAIIGILGIFFFKDKIVEMADDVMAHLYNITNKVWEKIFG